MKKMTVKGLFIDRFRGFRDFYLELNKGLNIIVGSNGIGKSSILLILELFLDGGSEYNFWRDEVEDLGFFALEWEELIVPHITTTEGQLRKYPLKIEDNLRNNLRSYLEDFEARSRVGTIGILNMQELSGRKGSFIVAKFKQSKGDSSGRERIYFISENELYEIDGYYLSLVKGLDFIFKHKVLNFNKEDYLKLLIEKFEEKPEMENYFTNFVEESSKKLNKISSTKVRSFEYANKPKMSIKVLNAQSKDIERLSEGEKQIEKLGVFSQSAITTEINFCLMDEPDLHLNLGQLSWIQQILNDLLVHDKQIFIATHSSFFIRSFYYKHLIYIKSLNGKVEQILLPEPKSVVRNYLSYPDAFFARKIIIVEGYTDKLFIERALEIFLREFHDTELSSKNIQVLAAGDKHAIKHLYKFVTENLKIKTLIISDLDLFIKDSDYSFLPEYLITKLNRLKKTVLKSQVQTSNIHIRKLNDTQKESFLKFLESCFGKRQITENDVIKFEKFKDYLKKNRWEISNNFLKKLLDKMTINNIIKEFRKEKVWLLNQGRLEDYVSLSLKKEGKVSIDKLQTDFYPATYKDLQKYIPEKVIDELKNLAETVYKWSEE